MGNRAGAVHLLDPGSGVVRNTANYRITEADRIGVGSLQQKFRQNLTAIECLKKIEGENRPATAEEKAILVKYVGWGGIPQVFSPAPPSDWVKEKEQLTALLTKEEYVAARESTLNAHYTSPVVIQAMYQSLEHLGFEGGRILEPACGVGHFIGLLPESMNQQSQITGIELDSITVRLAQKLYPDADIRHSAYEKSQLADGFYDVAISNVPFGDYQPYDSRFNQYHFPIHDYFFAASMERLRPGGLMLFISSKGTLDKKSSYLRRYLSKQADLVGAIRLPNTAFKANANTEVTTDIVILRKRLSGESPSGSPWQESTAYRNAKGEEMLLNEYFISHPQMMLGTMELTGSMYGHNEPTLVSDARDLGAALREACLQLPQKIYQGLTVENHPAAEITIPAPDEVKPNAFTIVDTPMGPQIAIREGSNLVMAEGLPGDTVRRIRSMIRVRDAVRECLRAQVEDAPEAQIMETRKRLNFEYDHFYGRFGAISERANTRAFFGDPDLPLLLSLENFNEETRRATKTAIFKERTIQRQKPAESAQTPKEALLISLNELGRVDLDRMSWLLKKGPEEFLPELKGIVFLNPQTQAWETEDAYLSGNIREKLAIAEAAALTDPRYKENVTALQSVQPEELKATEIDARLGSVWIPERDVEQFVEELLHISPQAVRIKHVAQLGSWSLQADYEAKSCVANTTEWGTPRYAAINLIEDSLNLRTPTVYDTDPRTENRVINASATEAAREKQQQIKERFTQWIWQDDTRRERLVKQYNEEFNNVRVRTFTGEHLTLPGANPIISLRPHQKAAVWRILQTPNTLLAHIVGAGKTFTMAAAAMEQKRLGLAQKPMIIVPNHMLGQFSSELLTLYPAANVLVAGKDDFEMARRQQLFSRIATGNWDVVIVTHSGFERIPISQEAQEGLLKEQIDDLEMAILRQKADRDFRRVVKELEAAKNRLETKLKTLSAEEKKDNTLTFEELGVDRIFVDEAHYFKNLFYVSKMTRIAGLPQTSSQRAFDMYLKVRHLQKLNGGGGVVFATGTPVTNTMAEMFTMQRYLQGIELEKQQLQHFDSWAATFGEPVTAMELSPDGAGYRLNTRFARFVNVPELMQQFRQMADIQTADMLQLPIPKLYQNKPLIVSAPTTPELKAFVASLAKRAEKLRSGSVDPSEDNMLKITGEGRKAALDMRLVFASRDHPQSKLSLAAHEIFTIWEQTKEPQLSQLVFCDLSTPQEKETVFSAYDDLKRKLIQKGVPTEEIAFIQSYESDSEKSALFKRVRTGQVRILMGSTAKMGTGTNVQERLIALHHLDAPWRPADIEQREGRILRQGNRNPEVKIFRYVTEGSFDSYMWGVLETKAKFIGQIMTKESHVRKIEDLDAPALTYAEVKAIASGNPLVIEKAKVDAEIMRLNRLRSQHSEAHYITRNSIRHTTEEIGMLERKIAALQQDLAVRQNTKGNAFTIQIENRSITERPVAGELLNRLAQKHLLSPKPVELGKFAGFTIRTCPERSDEIELCGKNLYSAKVSDSASGTMSSLEYIVRSMDERLTEYQKDIVAAKQRIVELQAHENKPFEHEQKLQALLGRQQEITQALDLTKNQASNQLSADAEKETAAIDEAPEIKQNVTPKQSIRVSV